MTTRRLVNVAASVFDRLKQRTRLSGEDFNVILLRYAGERLLYRLAQSSHSDSFTLKGGRATQGARATPERPREVPVKDGASETLLSSPSCSLWCPPPLTTRTG